MAIKSIFKNSKLVLSILFVFSTIQWAIKMINPLISAKFIDLVTNANINDKVYVFNFIKFILILSIIEFAIMFFTYFATSKLKLKYYIEFIKFIFNKIYKIDYLAFNEKESIYLAQQINEDVNTIVNFIIDNIFNIFINIILFIVSISLIFYLNFKIGLYTLFMMPVYMICYLVFKKHLYSSYFNKKENENIFFSHLTNLINNIKFIKLNSIDKYSNLVLINNFSKVNKSSIDFLKKSFIFSSSDEIFSKIFIIIIYFIGGYAIINKTLSIGNFIGINMYFGMCLASIQTLFSFGKSYQEYKVSKHRIQDTLNKPVTYNGKIKLESISEIELNNISLNINNLKIIEDFTYTFKSGYIYNIKGRNGIGKSTLLNLISGIYIPDKGNIYIDENDINDLDIYDLRLNNVCAVSQDSIFFNDSVLENIKLGKLEFNNSEILEILKIDKGMFSKNIHNLSGGQKQKINLCRSIHKSGSLILLDEPSTSLDIETIENFKNYLIKIKSDKIIIIVSHDEAYDQISDYILDFNNLASSLNKNSI